MNNISSRSLGEPRGEPEVPLYLAGKPRQENRTLSWWYRLASPPEPGQTASFKETERFRRGRAGSLIILALFLLFIISIPAGIIGTNTYLIFIVAGSVVPLIVGAVLNRMGYVNFAGTIVVLTSIAFPIANIVTTPGGMSMTELPLFGLLVLPLMSAVSFLPPLWTFLVAFGNICFAFYALAGMTHTAELNAILAIAFVGIITPIVLIQIIVSIVAYAWVQGTTQALQRADHAEELARLEHDLALQAEEAAQQKRLLESSIERVVQTHMRVANGDFSARVPLTQDNVLWQISGSLNNLLARLQRLRQEVSELEHVKVALHQAREENGRLVRALGKAPR